MRATVFFLLVVAWTTAAQAGDFAPSSPDIPPGSVLTGKHLYHGFGCTGKNVSPPLRWEHAPPGTQSFAVTLYDPDAPTGSGWWHWLVFDIPASVASLPEGAGDASGSGLSGGSLQSRTDFGKPGFGGACPPAGDAPHRYVFTVYALDVPRLDLPGDASPAMVGFTLHAHTLATATLTARYGR